jgi:preprotein translocase subunit SecE
VARDRKRAKQRRARGGGGAVGRRTAPDGAVNGAPAGAGEQDGTLERADVPAALDHASADVDEFDAALVRGAGGVPLDSTADEPRTLSEREIDQEAEVEGDVTEDELQELSGVRAATPAQASGAPIRGGNRAIGFLRASWAELQRVQWPDRRQVTQATAVVLGFVAIAGLYLGAADYVAKEIVELIL